MRFLLAYDLHDRDVLESIWGEIHDCTDCTGNVIMALCELSCSLLGQLDRQGWQQDLENQLIRGLDEYEVC
jgi:hypothetical protein